VCTPVCTHVRTARHPARLSGPENLNEKTSSATKHVDEYTPLFLAVVFPYTMRVETDAGRGSSALA
jgi:hypothetical protein